MSSKYKLAIEDESRSSSSSPPNQNVPLNAFLVYDNHKPEKCKKHRSASVPDIDTHKTDGHQRRYSVCDLDTTSPIMYDKNEGSRHHRRSTVALKFQPPKKVD